MIARNDGTGIIPEIISNETPSKQDLVYTEESPNFCNISIKIGSLGTKGRECDPNSNNTNGCDHLCCERGFHQETIDFDVNCKCVFKWCCEVVCSKCPQKKKITTCL